MSIDKKLAFFCLAGYTTEAGKQEAQMKCTAQGWVPEPRCFRESRVGLHLSEDKTFSDMWEVVKSFGRPEQNSWQYSEIPQIVFSH